jgi:peptidoglycan/LPS O-acetylase OafA/YrhL
VMWSMKVECFATPLILFCALAVKRELALWLWGLVLVLFGLSFWGAYVHLLGDATNLAPLHAFVVGVLVQHYGPRLRLAAPLATLAALASIALFLYCGTRKQTAPILLLECLSAAWLVVAVAFHPLAIFKPLDFWLARFYGRISYSFYLLHVLGMLFASRIVGTSLSGLPVSLGTVLLTLLTIALTTPAAYVFWRYIEVPGLNLGKRFANSYVRAPAPIRSA